VSNKIPPSDIRPQITRAFNEELSDGDVGVVEEPLELGKRLKAIRLANNLTLEEASRLTGLARSTLSKIENEQISPSFQAVQKLTAGLGVDIPQLFSPLTQDVGANSRRDVTREGEGQPHPTTTYEHE
jgi:DNA-binding XRE family transcriptional regulator